MKKALLFLTFLFSMTCFSQKMVEFKLLETKEDILKYFDSLVKEADCKLFLEKDLANNGNILLSLDLPAIQDKVLASSVWADFYYDKTKKKDICIRMGILSSNQNIDKYLDFVRNNSIRNEEGKWIHQISSPVDSINVYVTFTFNPYSIETKSSFILEAEIHSEKKKIVPKNNEPKFEISYGTGFSVSNNLIMTCYHVVKGSNQIFVKGINGRIDTAFEVQIKFYDEYSDLALLKIKSETTRIDITPPYSLKYKHSEVGENIFVLGYPLQKTMGQEIKLTTGVISSNSGFLGDSSLFQISAPIQPGNSGGPLFDYSGYLIGMVSAKHKNADNVGYAIKLSSVKNILTKEVISNNLNKSVPVELSKRVKLFKDYIYSIEATNDNIGKTVKIGNQEWMSENLNVSHFANGDPIPEAKTNEEWRLAGESGNPAWCFYDNDPSNGPIYGKLYNWYAVKDKRGLAPIGFHIPNNEEWEKLINGLGGEFEASKKMKSTMGWWGQEGNGNNSSGFTALPGSWRGSDNNFFSIADSGYWWSSTETNTNDAWSVVLLSFGNEIYRSSTYKLCGLSVRCLRD